MKIRVAFLMTACKKSGPVQQMLNIMISLDRVKFDPLLVTIYEEPTDGTSQIEQFLMLNITHIFCPLSKTDILLGRIKKLENVLESKQVDVIHSLGVFPDYAIARINPSIQLITLRNYIYEDYPAKFGKIKGIILAKLHLYAIKRAVKTVACSKSLSQIYLEKLNINLDFIRNGVNLKKYKRVKRDEKEQLRKKLGLSCDSFIFVYSGQIIIRKNHRFLVNEFSKRFNEKNIYLLILGDGLYYQKLYDEFKDFKNIDLRGSVDNVSKFLQASDVYVSVSKSEGMPNGVLEAMGSGLPVILSNIPQHMELFEVNQNIGFYYRQNDGEDLTNKMKLLISNFDLNEKMSDAAYKTVHGHFSAKANSEQYQKLYAKIAESKQINR